MSDVPAPLRRDAEAVLRAGIGGAEPGAPVAAALAAAGELRSAGRVLVLAFGKAAVSMADAAAHALGDRMTAALVVAPHGNTPPAAPRTRFLTAAHPLPDEHSVAAARAAGTFLEAAGTGDLVVALISGGGSALLCDPAPGLTLADVVRATRELQRAGADIRELNAVRRRIDRVKGGRLADRAAPARVLCLAVSDVPGDDPAVIASGPFTADAGTAQPANVRYQVVASNAQARAAAASQAESLGYRVEDAGLTLRGEARELGGRIGELAARANPGSALLGGGETTVTVRGAGHGGRNQELALAAALRLAGTAQAVVGAVGTDGIDGDSPAAGAIVDGTTCARIAAAGGDAVRALAENDSYTALAAAGDVLITGPTGTNVMDLVVVLKG